MLINQDPTIVSETNLEEILKLVLETDYGSLGVSGKSRKAVVRQGIIDGTLNIEAYEANRFLTCRRTEAWCAAHPRRRRPLDDIVANVSHLLGEG
jgi:hypothetical protein